MKDEKKPPAGRRVARKRRAEVLDAAARVFHAKGYSATTIQDIADEVGILKGSVYYYISSKQDLLFELVQQYHDDTRSYFEAIVASDASPVDKLRELITTETTHTARNLERSTLFYTEWRSLPQDRQAVIIAERARHERAVQEWIAQAQEVGGIRREIDPKIASFAIFGMVNSVYRWFTPGGRKSAEEIGRDFSDLVLGGLLAPG